MYRTGIALLTLFMLGSCEKEIPFHTPGGSNRLVVNSLFTEGELWTITVTHSLNVLDPGTPSPLANAQVLLRYADGTYIETLPYDGVAYRSTVTASHSQAYRVEVSVPGYAQVFASDGIPAPVLPQLLDTMSVYMQGTPFLRVRIRFQDPVGAKNFYLLRAYSGASSGVGRVEYEFALSGVASGSSGDTEDRRRTWLLSDGLFEGQQVEMSCYIPQYHLQYQTDPVYLELSACSEAYYRYLYSIELYRDVEGNPFAEPVQVFSNVENGIGIVAGKSSRNVRVN